MRKAEREQVWLKYDKHCAYCGKILKYTELQVDHIKPKRRGRWVKYGGPDEMSNYNPSCRRCNHYKRKYSLKRFSQLIRTLHLRIEDHYINKIALDYGIIVEIKPHSGKFFYETYQEGA